MRTEEAKLILESDSFKEAVNQVRESFIFQIVNNPTDCLEATMGLHTLNEIVSALESALIDYKVSAHNNAESN